MKLFLVRHGDADAEIPEGLDDDARPLTARGRTHLQTHFAALAPHLGTPAVMFMSPLVRAVQTATLLAVALKYEGPLRTTRALFPDGPVGAIEGLLALPASGPVVLVGHQPSMGAIAAHFLGMNGFPRTVTPGTVIGLDRADPANTKLVLLASPGQPIAESL